MRFGAGRPSPLTRLATWWRRARHATRRIGAAHACHNARRRRAVNAKILPLSMAESAYALGRSFIG